jgi:Cu(I)/Ag(I) efflux system membrane fusion protein/cobalt-zinc-cadmium efflux system membrane fusion protein
MMNKVFIYAIILVVGVVLGAGIFYMFTNSSGSENHAHTSEEQLYTCGMHPDIIESEPGTCPICGMNLTPIKSKNSNSNNSNDKGKIIYWRAPMNPNEVYDSPGKSQMGMDLVPVYENEGSDEGVVTVDGSILQSMNVKMEFVKNRNLNSSIYTNGVVTTDERKEFVISSKLTGWIEKLYINFVGQKVAKGQKLMEIYSPELVAAQQELITALKFKETSSSKTSNDLVQNAIRKLELLDIAKSEIDAIINSKQTKKYIPLYAPSSGTILVKEVVEGQKITPNKQLMAIADLSSLWIKADIYESELGGIKVGTDTEITFNYSPGKIYKGKITFIYPTVDPLTRTVSVRIDIQNKDAELKPAMFGNVKISNNRSGEMLSVPETAVIRSGKKNIVVLGLGEGKFKPVEVILGNYSEGYFQVIKGLKLNDKIVTSGQFMLDSESSLRSAVKLFSSSNAKEVEEHNMTDEEMANMESEKEVRLPANNQSDKEASIVRDGIINVEAVDINGDGKVFQDPMDWNVISDKAGRCPVCGMFLKEVTIEDAKKNLTENGFEYK